MLSRQAGRIEAKLDQLITRVDALTARLDDAWLSACAFISVLAAVMSVAGAIATWMRH